MSEKPSPKPSPGKPPANTAGNGPTSGTKGAASTGRSKANADHDDAFDFLEPALQANELGRLAHYRILKVLGRGGMGTVFMAEDTRLHRIVALKVMLPSIAKKPIARDRFLREARATAAIDHDHIITIYEVNGDSEVPYAAMQYLKGMTLEDWLRAGKKLNVPQIMRIAREIAKGLAAAHARQLIHRDIKPSNIWLDAANKGRVKILDFGLARPTNEETHLTQEGMILGTPAYMSPEQARGQAIDERCDLFSLGCVLYRLCAGRLPFMGKDAMSMLLAITSEEPTPLLPLNRELPPAFADLVHRFLAKKPDDRPASAKSAVQTIQDIERDWIAGTKTVTASPPRTDAAPPDEPTAAESRPSDPALEESAITELEMQDTPRTSVTGAAPARNRGWIFASLAGAAFALLSIVCCLGIAVATDHGHVEIVVDEDVKALLPLEGLTLWDHHKKAHKVKLGANRLPSGGYRFDPENLPGGLRVEPIQLQLDRGETLRVKVHSGTVKARNAIAPPLVLVSVEDAKRVQEEWAGYLRIPVETVNSLDAALTLIPPGEFYMGTSKDQLNELLRLKKSDKKGLFDLGYSKRILNEMPQHRVRISKAFYLGNTEVTVGQFEEFATKNGGYATVPEASKKGGTGLDNGKELARRPEFTWRSAGPGYKPTMNHPVTNITWKDAEAFCAWLSEKEKKIYRLPTAAEWEYACRAGANTLWSFGDDARDNAARTYMWCQFSGKLPGNPLSPNAVGKKLPNHFGLFDMHGNAAEMCADFWSSTFYEQSVKEGLATDPRGPEPGTATMRVLRGGSFLDAPHLVRSAYRHSQDPALASVQMGFRVVQEVPPPE